MERDGNANGEVDKKAPPNTQANQIYKELKIKPVKNSEGSIDLGDQNKQNEVGGRAGPETPLALVDFCICLTVFWLGPSRAPSIF